jgi:predicted nucleic acid-binding protein
MINADLDLQKTVKAMELLDTWIARLQEQFAPDIVDRFDNALLNIAVHRLVDEEGARKTATMLFRLAEIIAEGKDRSFENPVELNKLDG